jgi:hypothetical protein
MLDILKIRCNEILCKNPPVVLFSLLMELYHALTPTCSGNHKAFLEGFWEGENKTFSACRVGSTYTKLLDGNSKPYSSLHINALQRIYSHDLIDQGANIAAIGERTGKSP